MEEESNMGLGVDVKVANVYNNGGEQDCPFLTPNIRRCTHRLSLDSLRACSQPIKRGLLWFQGKPGFQFISFKQVKPYRGWKLPAVTRFPPCPGVPANFFPWQHASVAFVRAAEATSDHTLSLTSHGLAVPPKLPANIMQHDSGMTIVVKRQQELITVPLHSVQVHSAAPGGLLASDVGTGKTAVMLHTAVDTRQDGPTLIIVPTTLEGQWVSEAQRMYGASVVTDPAKFQKDTINVWRCNTRVSYSKIRPSTPNAPWTIVLTTYDFLAARVKELCGSSKRFVDFAPLLEHPALFSAQHNLPTCFHDIQWNRIIFDEVQDGLTRCNHQFWRFANALPTRHVWAMSATPTDFKSLVEVLRLNAVCRTETLGKDVSKLMRELSIDISYSLLQPRLFRVTKEDTTEKMRTGVQCTIVPLTLTDTEKKIMQYLRLLGGVANDALVCTDVESFLRELMSRKDTLPGTGEAVVCTFDAFWDRMRFENVTVGRDLEKELKDLRDRIAELHHTMDALTDAQEISAVRAEMRRQESMLKTRQANMAKVTVKQEFLDGLNERIEDAKANPCPICVDDIGEGRMAITVCGHVFCIDCIKSWFGKHNSCPACRRTPLDMSDVTVVKNDVLAAPTPMPAQPQSVYSTKIDFLLTHLRHVLSTTPDRVIVFCNYPATLRKLYKVLVSEGIDVACMMGNVHGKNKNMLKFKGRGNYAETCRVMLLHTVTQNSGMDLIEANRIVFVDAHLLSPEVLQQAHGRCARLGQTKDIHLTFLTVPEFEKIPPLQQYVSGLQSVGDTTK